MSRVLEDAKPEEVGLSAAGLDKVDAGLQALIDEGALAGAVTLAARRGRVARRSVLGLNNIARGEPPKVDTIYRIFSMTKPVTAVAMMILRDEGKWSPDDPIAKHLPAFADVRVFDGVDADGSVRTVAAKHAPTLLELMTHTAGLSYGGSPEPFDQPYKDAKIWSAGSLDAFIARVAKLPLCYQPGEKWLYSIAMDVQGAIVEKLSGMSLADFMRTRIFEPLGMADTGFYVPQEKLGRLATLYRQSRAEGLVELDSPRQFFNFDHLSEPEIASAGGGLVSTLDDYARFAQMLLNKGELGGVRILSERAVGEMTQNHLPEWMLRKGFGIGAMQIRPGFGYGYNGAVFTDPDAAGIPVGRGTYEWDGAAQTWFWVDYENDLIFVGMIQRLSMMMDQTNCQQLTQKLMAGAIL